MDVTRESRGLNLRVIALFAQFSLHVKPSDRGDAIEEIGDDGTNGVLEQKEFKTNIDSIG